MDREEKSLTDINDLQSYKRERYRFNSKPQMGSHKVAQLEESAERGDDAVRHSNHREQSER